MPLLWSYESKVHLEHIIGKETSNPGDVYLIDNMIFWLIFLYVFWAM